MCERKEKRERLCGYERVCTCGTMCLSVRERDREREHERVKENVFEKERVHFCSKKEKDERAKKIFGKN